MNRFTPPHGASLDQDSFSRGPLQQCSLKTPDTSPSSIIGGVRYGDHRPGEPCSTAESWSDSSSSSPEAIISYQPPWAMETAPSCSIIMPLSPIESVPDGLPRISHDWPASLTAPSNYSPPRQLKPETRRLPDGKHSSDWVHALESSLGFSYRSSQPVGRLSPHSQPASSSSTNPTTTSPASISMPYHHLLSTSTVVSASIKPEVDCDGVAAASASSSSSNLEQADDTNVDPPYSQLIYQALRDAPGMKLPLQEIYLWFEKNTAKGRDQSSKGWQNSIRHNLSMNAGFEAVREESVPGKKAVNFWRLTDEAINNGIQSTTRYRKQANYEKSMASDPPVLQRQRTGAKGGKATKITARIRSSMSSTSGNGHNSSSVSSSSSFSSQDEIRREQAYRPQRITHSSFSTHRQHLQKPFYRHYLHSHRDRHHHHSHSHYDSPTTTAPTTPTTSTVLSQPIFASGVPTTLPITRSLATPTITTTTAAAIPTTTAPAEPFDLANVVGCADPVPCAAAPAPIFCDMAGPSPDCLAFDAGFMGWNGVHSSFPSGLLTGPEISSSDLHLGL